MEQRRRARPERRTAQQRDAQLDRIEAKLDEALALLRRLTGDYTARAGGVGTSGESYKIVIDEGDGLVTWTDAAIESVIESVEDPA